MLFFAIGKKLFVLWMCIFIVNTMKKVKIRDVGDGKNAQVSISAEDLEYAGLKIGDRLWRVAEKNGIIRFEKVESGQRENEI